MTPKAAKTCLSLFFSRRKKEPLLSVGGFRIIWGNRDLNRGQPALKIIIDARAGEPEPGVFGSLEPEPELLEKKTGAGAGRSRVFYAPWSRRRSKINSRSRSRSRLGKKPGAGAG